VNNYKSISIYFEIVYYTITKVLPDRLSPHQRIIAKTVVERVRSKSRAHNRNLLITRVPRVKDFSDSYYICTRNHVPLNASQDSDLTVLSASENAANRLHRYGQLWVGASSGYTFYDSDESDNGGLSKGASLGIRFFPFLYTDSRLRRLGLRNNCRLRRVDQVFI